MDENTLDTNRQVISTPVSESSVFSLVSKYRKPIFWVMLIILVGATWYFSRSLETRGTNNGASVFFSGQKTENVGLYTGKALPDKVSIRAGDTVEFVVVDESRHYIAERRSESNRGDARIASGEFGPGESYSVQFNSRGTFSFYDRMNQDISIDIEVR
jgi:plastocyanin